MEAAIFSSSSSLDKAKDVSALTEKNYSMTGRITAVPFEFIVWNLYHCSNRNMRPAKWFIWSIVSYPAKCFALLDVNFVAKKCICRPAA